MTPAARHRLALALLWITPALWSSNYIIARLAAGRIAPHQLALGRWTLAVLMMLPLVGAVLWRERAALRREWPQLLVLGALGMWVCGAFVYIGGKTTTSLNIALIYSASPVAIAWIGTRLAGERLKPVQRWGLAMSLVGVVYVIAKGDWHTLIAVRFNPGDAWIAAATVCWTAYSVLLGHWKSALPTLPRLAAIAAGGVVVLIPFTVLEASLAPQPELGASGWGLIAVAALVPGLLSYGAYSFLMRELGAARTVLLLYLAPLYGALLAWVILDEPPHLYHAVGAALILPSIYLASRR